MDFDMLNIYNNPLYNIFESFIKRSKESLERSKIAAREYERGKLKTIEQVFNN
ncbi:MAG: hypothetical protein AABX96_03925 [Nanoarchaeota archaeon]